MVTNEISPGLILFTTTIALSENKLPLFTSIISISDSSNLKSSEAPYNSSRLDALILSVTISPIDKFPCNS